MPLPVAAFEPEFMKVGVLTAALQELTPREARKIDEAAACMYPLQHRVLPAEGIPVLGRGREACRS